MVNVLKFRKFFSFCSQIKCWISGLNSQSACQKSKTVKTLTVLDFGLISIVSLGPRASTKVESNVNFTESQKVSQPNFFFAILNTEKLAKTIN